MSYLNVITDIALIRLDAPFDNSHGNISGIEINKKISNVGIIGKMATISGWGSTKGGSVEQQRYLQKTTLQMTSNGLPKDTVLALDNKDGKGLCHGDSGGMQRRYSVLCSVKYITKSSIFSTYSLVLGPATIKLDGRDLLVGIASKSTRYPFLCGDPDDYSMCTSIYSFREWILQHVNRIANTVGTTIRNMTITY